MSLIRGEVPVELNRWEGSTNHGLTGYDNGDGYTVNYGAVADYDDFDDPYLTGYGDGYGHGDGYADDFGYSDGDGYGKSNDADVRPLDPLVSLAWEVVK